jgi:hypothetical protein
MTDKVAYQAVVGSLLHLVQCTRPDLAPAIGALAAYCSAPSAAHHAALINCSQIRWLYSLAGHYLWKLSSSS